MHSFMCIHAHNNVHFDISERCMKIDASLLHRYRLVIATNAKTAIRNGYHMFTCETGIDDITII